MFSNQNNYSGYKNDIIWKLNNTPLVMQWVKEEIFKEVTYKFKLNVVKP